MGVMIQVQPSKRSGEANATPLCSEPAIGCAPTKVMSFLKLWEICSTIYFFVLPTSVRMALLFIKGIIFFAVSIILFTDVAKITISASLTASSSFKMPMSIACILMAFSNDEVLWPTPIMVFAKFLKLFEVTILMIHFLYSILMGCNFLALILKNN